MGDISDDEFRSSIRHFYEHKGDPTRSVYWSAERCKRLMPCFYEAWTQSRTYEKLADMAVKEEAPYVE